MKTEKRSERLYLQHIIEASLMVDEYKSLGKDKFFESHLVQNAIEKVVGNIAESAGNLMDSTKAEYREIPWQTVKAFRNVLVHDYLGDLDYDELWDIINKDLPLLVEVVKKILKEKYAAS